MGRQRDRAAPADQRPHRRKQHRIRHRFEVARTLAIGVHPTHFPREPQHLQECQEDADREDAGDQTVEAGIGGEGRGDLPSEDGDHEPRQRQEDQHRPEKHHRRGQPVRIEIDRSLRFVVRRTEDLHRASLNSGRFMCLKRPDGLARPDPAYARPKPFESIGDIAALLNDYDTTLPEPSSKERRSFTISLRFAMRNDRPNGPHEPSQMSGTDGLRPPTRVPALYPLRRERP